MPVNPEHIDAEVDSNSVPAPVDDESSSWPVEKMAPEVPVNPEHINAEVDSNLVPAQVYDEFSSWPVEELASKKAPAPESKKEIEPNAQDSWFI